MECSMTRRSTNRWIRDRLFAALLCFSICLSLVATSDAYAAEKSNVVTLTSSNFKDEIKDGFWILKFYAPWCGHCKRLAPLWDELSVSQSIAKLGKIDVTKNEELGKEHEIKVFPTIKFAKNGKFGQYNGPRTKDGFIHFIERMSAPPVTEVGDIRVLEELYSASSPVLFVLTVGTEAPGINIDVTDAFISAASNLQALSKFVILRLKSLSSDTYTIAKMEPDHQAVYLPVVEGQAVSQATIEEFIVKHQRPLVSRIDSHNFKELGDIGKPMVIAVVKNGDDGKIGEEMTSEEFVEAFTHSVAALQREDSEKYIFGVLDGVRWKRFLKQYDTSASSLLVLDMPKGLHYNTKVPISGESLKATTERLLKQLLAGELAMEASEEKNIFKRAYKKIRTYYPWSLLAFIPVVLFLVSFLLPHPDSKPKEEAFSSP